MRRTILAMFVFVAVAAGAGAQTSKTTAVTPRTLQLTLDDAVKMSLDHNVDLNVDRLDPQISDTRVAAAAGAFKPSFNASAQRNNQLQPPSSFLIPTATRNDVVTSNAGLGQKLPWFGTSYSLGWTTTHTDSNSFLSSYNPLVQSGLSLNVSQPLIRDLSIDQARQQLATSRTNRDIADTRLRESVVHTTANVKSWYWALVAAIDNVQARQTAVDLARELVRVNKAKVDVGQSPPLDLVSAQAEVASNQEQLIIAQTTVKQVEDRLRLLIFDPTDRDNWAVKIEPVDSPPVDTVAVDIDSAVTNALRDRADILRGRKDIENSQLNIKYASNQKLPDVRLNASYLASGLGGTQVLRTGGFPGTIVGPGDTIGFGSVVNQLFQRNYPTWAAGVSVSYPIGQSTEEANYARTKLERAQNEERLKATQARAIQQVRDAGWKIEMNAKRIETTRAALQLAEQRLDAERKRFDVGMSTSFLVIQAQRDLAEARTNELSAVLAYDLALVDFEALQQAGPAGQSSGSSGGSSNGGESAPASLPPVAAVAPTTSSTVPGVRP
jgi:outer membrane protein TolC